MPNSRGIDVNHVRKSCGQRRRVQPKRRRYGALLRGAFFIFAICRSVCSVGATTPPANSVTLRWDASPSSDVGGYRVYYGKDNGVYTNMVDAGNSTSVTISGLQDGVIYYFVVSAYDSFGEESDYSNEVSYAPASVSTLSVFTLQLRAGSGGQMILTGTGMAARTYDVQASTDLKNWTVINRMTVTAGETLNFTDADAVNFPSRFYRVVETQPSVQLRVVSGQQPDVTVIGQYNYTYDLQASPNLQDWLVIGTVTLGTNGATEITDTAAGNEPVRFYRTRER